MKSDLLNNYDKICIVGDFNYPSVRWDGEWSNNKDSKFVECVRCAFLTQMVKKKKIGGEDLLALVLVNEEKMIMKLWYSHYM